MNILLVEDQEVKVQDALRCLRPMGVVRHAWSYVDAKRALKEGWATAVVLDMTLPIYTGQARGPDSPYVYGGEELLKWAYPRLDMPPTVIFTQFDSFVDRGASDSLETLASRLSSDYPTCYRGVVRYGIGLPWEEQLVALISSIDRNG